jgi:polysaccharide pyruvyl transferase WcaK-like protein
MSVAETASAPPRLRVGVFGGFGIGNFGNDASLEAVLAYLTEHYPGAAVTCVCTNPAGLPKRLGASAITTVLRPKGLWRIADTLLLRQPSAWTNMVRSLLVMGDFDVLLIAGTGVFDDFRDTPLG